MTPKNCTDQGTSIELRLTKLTHLVTLAKLYAWAKILFLLLGRGASVDTCGPHATTSAAVTECEAREVTIK